MRGKRVFFAVGIGVLLAVVVAGTSGGVAISPEDRAAFRDVMRAEELRRTAYVYPAAALLQQLEGNASEELAEARLLEAYREVNKGRTVDFSQCFAGGLAEKYQNGWEEWKGVPHGKDPTVAAGILRSGLIRAETLSPTQKKLKLSQVSWDARIYDCGDGYFMVTLIFSRDTMTVPAILENGVWKVTGYQEHWKEFVPDSYDPVMGVFPTYEAALRCVMNLDAAAENPFL